MGQSEVQQVLEKDSREYISTVKIAQILNQKPNVISKSLNTMLKAKEVFKMKVGRNHYWKIKKENEGKPNLIFIQ
jgi:hypothetical protein